MKKHEDDDGRRIADMSALENAHLILPKRSIGENTTAEDVSGTEEQLQPTKEEKKAIVFASIKASLLIGGVFLAAAAVFILFCIFVWFR